MSDTTAIYALIGTAVGALGTQLAGISQDIRKGRARKIKAAAKAAENRQARQRPIYLALLNAITRLTLALMDYRQMIEAGDVSDPMLMTQIRGAVGGGLEEVDSAVSEVQIDGGRQAQVIAEKLTAEIRFFANQPKKEKETAERVDELIAVLGRAQDALLKAARIDVGVHAERYGGRHLRELGDWKPPQIPS